MTGSFASTLRSQCDRVPADMSPGPLPAGLRVLIAAYEIPGYGGASTAAYGLFRKMQASGVDAHFINIIDEKDQAYFHVLFGPCEGNPAGLVNVHNCILNQAEFFADPLRTGLSELIGDIAPDVMLGMDVIPSSMLKQSAPDRKLIFLACGSDQARWYLEKGDAQDMVSLRQSLSGNTFPPAIRPGRELEAMRLADLVLANADDLRDIFRLYYPAWSGKVVSKPLWFAEWICEEAEVFKDLARPFADRQFDVLFVSSLWNRHVKNFALAADIIARCRDLNICIVGEIEHEAGHAVCTGFVSSRQEMFGILGNARTLVSTSNMDAAPGILFEAAKMGCNIVASRNCGNWRICHEDLLVDPYHLQGFVKNIRQSVQKKYPDNLHYFLGQNGYQELIDTMAVV